MAFVANFVGLFVEGIRCSQAASLRRLAICRQPGELNACNGFFGGQN
jgi:hypothetical protein